MVSFSSFVWCLLLGYLFLLPPYHHTLSSGLSIVSFIQKIRSKQYLYGCWHGCGHREWMVVQQPRQTQSVLCMIVSSSLSSSSSTSMATTKLDALHNHLYNPTNTTCHVHWELCKNDFTVAIISWQWQIITVLVDIGIVNSAFSPLLAIPQMASSACHQHAYDNGSDMWFNGKSVGQKWWWNYLNKTIIK